VALYMESVRCDNEVYPSPCLLYPFGLLATWKRRLSACLNLETVDRKSICSATVMYLRFVSNLEGGSELCPETMYRKSICFAIVIYMYIDSNICIL